MVTQGEKTFSCMDAIILIILKIPEYSLLFYQSCVPFSVSIILDLEIKNQKKQLQEWEFSMK
jgi:hypothetical protein